MDLVRFYLGQAPDCQGRTLSQILAWDDDTLEGVHDYIQVLFPLAEPSRFNSRAPLLDAATVAAFNAPEGAPLRANLLRSFDRMLRFYGLEREGQAVRKADPFERRAPEWLFPGDHNHLRITRILKSLSALGLAEYARGFLACLLEIHRERPRAIDPETVRHWADAVPS